MALIQGTTAVGLIVGSAGGNTYSRNRGGNYVKPRKTSTNPNTMYQQSIRAIVGTLPARWRALSDDQRGAFNAQSPNFPYTNKIGIVSYYSGYNLFCKFTCNLLMIGRTPITDAVGPTDNGVINSFACSNNDSGDIQLDFECSGTLTHATVLILATTQQSAGVGVVSKSTYKVVSYQAASSSFSAHILSDFTARGLTNSTGLKNFFQALLINATNGQSSNRVICSAIAS